MTWWQRLLAWLGISEPGTRKEQVEDWIETHGPTLDAFRDRQVVRRAIRGNYFQRLRGWLKPTDDTDPDEVNDFAGILPVWADVSIDVWEAPPRGSNNRGYTLNIWVTEADLTLWVLRIDTEAGSLGWSEIKATI
jgi:hypothetical protein